MKRLLLTLSILSFSFSSYGGFCTTEKAKLAAIEAYNEEFNAKLPTDGSYDDDLVTARFVSSTDMGDAQLKLFEVVLDVQGGSGTWAITLDGNNDCKTLTSAVVQTD